MPRYEFTDQAESDLDSITDYTLEQWGKDQAIQYIDGLESLAQTLVENPDIGVHRKHLFEGLMSFPYVSHILYYVKQPHGITIIRVLHQRMDPKRHVTTSQITQ